MKMSGGNRHVLCLAMLQLPTSFLPPNNLPFNVCVTYQGICEALCLNFLFKASMLQAATCHV